MVPFCPSFKYKSPSNTKTEERKVFNAEKRNHLYTNFFSVQSTKMTKWIFGIGKMKSLARVNPGFRYLLSTYAWRTYGQYDML